MLLTTMKNKLHRVEFKHSPFLICIQNKSELEGHSDSTDLTCGEPARWLSVTVRGRQVMACERHPQPRLQGGSL